jgi:quercetin dioxygenase-like cupin family protein
MTTRPTQPFINTRQDPEFRFLGVPTLLRAHTENTNGAFALVEHHSMPPGFGSPFHTHEREDESFYILEGQIAFLIGDQWIKATSGDFLFGPRLIPHGYRVIGNAPARMLVLCAPSGFEKFLKQMGEPIDHAPAPHDPARLTETAALFGITIHGPLPPEPSHFA